MWLYWGLLTDENSYLKATGWKESAKRRLPSGVDGSPIPWMNYPIIAFLNKRLHKDINLFEYGSGYSTLFFAERVKFVRTIEYDEKWFELINQKLPENTEIHYVKNDVDGKYCRAIGMTEEKYDVIVIDGRDRVNCLIQGIDRLNESGVIIFDDSQREKYLEAFHYARSKGFKVLDIEGMTAKKFDLNTTSVIYRNVNCLGL